MPKKRRCSLCLLRCSFPHKQINLLLMRRKKDAVINEESSAFTSYRDKEKRDQKTQLSISSCLCSMCGCLTPI